MNNTTLGNASLLPGYDVKHASMIMITSMVTLILQLPVNIYILQLIISRRCITTEFYTLNVAMFEIFLCFNYILGIAMYFSKNTYMMTIRRFLLGFLVTGRPSLLTVICVEHYIAVVKPVAFLRLKLLKYKLAFAGIIWLWTLLSCSLRFVLTSIFHYIIAVQIGVYCVVKLYCCTAILRVLKQPGPGEANKQTEGMGKMKRRAFRIILIVTVSVILVYVPLMVVTSSKSYLASYLFLDIINVCYTISIFAGFVQALLFLQRAGKLTFIKCP